MDTPYRSLRNILHGQLSHGIHRGKQNSGQPKNTWQRYLVADFNKSGDTWGEWEELPKTDTLEDAC